MISRTLGCATILGMAAISGCTAINDILTEVAGLTLTKSGNSTVPTPIPLERAAKLRFLVVDELNSGIKDQLGLFAEFESYGSQNIADYSAIVIDGDAIGADKIRDHAAVTAALAASVPVIVAEPSADHNAQLVYELVGMWPQHDLAALLLDCVSDSTGRKHWAIVEGGGPLDDHPYKSDAQALADEHYYFAAAVLEYLENGRFDLEQRIEPENATAKSMLAAADSDESSLAAPAGAKFKHVYQVMTGRATGLTVSMQGDTRGINNLAAVNSAYTQLLTTQAPSHSIANSWFFYHNDGGNASDDFNGQDCYVAILHQKSTFSLGASGMIRRAGNELGYFQEYVTLRTTPYTYPSGQTSSLSPLYLQVEDTSPTNVNQVTHEEQSHGTSTTKTFSFGISNQGISAGGEISVTDSVSFSTSRDISDWGILNLADPGSGTTSWVFHQQTPCDPYQGNFSCRSDATPKTVPALSQGANVQETVSVWSTIGVDPSDADRNAYRMAFKTDATQQIKMLGFPTVNVIFFNIQVPGDFGATLSSSRTYALELSDAFFGQ